MSGDRYGKEYGYGADAASTAYGAAASKNADDAWAKSAKGDTRTSRYGKSYDVVSAKNYDHESYARKVDAKDSQEMRQSSPRPELCPSSLNNPHLLPKIQRRKSLPSLMRPFTSPRDFTLVNEI